MVSSKPHILSLEQVLVETVNNTAPEIVSFDPENKILDVPKIWNLSRKHFRIRLFNNKFLKLNKLENRLNERELKRWLVKYVPVHVYFSVLDWLFPERVGKKHKTKHERPIAGEYVVDVDYYSLKPWHSHHFYGQHKVCEDCLNLSKHLTLATCKLIEENYSKVEIVFSGRRGFHIHVLDFDLKDWTRYNVKDPVKSHEVARFKYTQHLADQAYVFNRYHFILSVDPMRVMSLPNSLNAVSGLVCLYIGSRLDLEKMRIRNLVEEAKPVGCIYPLRFDRPVYAHPELPFGRR